MKIALTLCVKSHSMFLAEWLNNSLAAIGLDNIMRIPQTAVVSTGNPAVIASSSTIPPLPGRQDAVINPPPPLIPNIVAPREEVNITAHAAFFCQASNFRGLSCPTTYSNVLWRRNPVTKQVLQWNDRHLYA